MATGTNLFTSHEARILAHTPNDANYFLLGNNQWVNWRKYIFGNKNNTRDELTITDSSWAVVPSGGIDVFGLSFKDTSLSTDTGDWRAWLSSPSDGYTILNMRIDGDWTASTFHGALDGNATTATSTTRLARIGDNTEGADTTVFSTDGLNVRWYYNTGKVPEQPTQYGFLFTVGTGENSSENHQFWASQANGSIYHRGTNGSSYNSPPAFKTILDSDNYTSYTVTKTGTGASGTWGISITGNAATVSRATFGDSSNGEHNANNIASNGLYYYNSNGPSTSTNQFKSTDGSIYCQAYSTSWVTQIAQDYRNGSIAVRGKNNGSWTAWVSIPKMTVDTYPALLPANGENNWIKIGTTNASYGLLPSQAGNAGNGHNYLGTSSWYWKYAYIDEIYSVHTRGAVWNDYAEYRKAYEYEPGYAISPSGRYTKTRLESGARIISDTYGFAIGYMENRKDMVPVAISGRVLAYPLHNKSYYKIGDAVCATKDGKIDKMTRKEIKEYPDRIIGIVNEIPDYDIWEPSREGGITEPIHTNGRIWIDVR